MVYFFLIFAVLHMVMGVVNSLVGGNGTLIGQFNFVMALQMVTFAQLLSTRKHITALGCMLLEAMFLHSMLKPVSKAADEAPKHDGETEVPQ